MTTSQDKELALRIARELRFGPWPLLLALDEKTVLEFAARLKAAWSKQYQKGFEEALKSFIKDVDVDDRDIARYLYQAGAANALRQQWQPIETAPKDGTFVLVSNGRGVWVARFKDVYTSGWKPECPWQSMMLNHDHIPTQKRKGHPSHWMPLPAAPQDNEKMKGEEA